MKRTFVRDNWWLSILRGVIVLLFGIFATIRPVGTIVILARILGVYFLIDGLFIIFMSLRNKKQNTKWKSTLIRGIIATVIGAVVLFVPAFTVATIGIFFMYILGALALVHGVMDLIKISRAKDETQNKWALVFSGVFFILLAILLFIAPLQFGIVLIRIIGILSIIVGGGLLFIALRNRRPGNG